MKSIAAILILLSISKACELDFWVFDNLDHCSEPNETGSIVADGRCRSVGLNSAFPFPGYYRATCAGSGLRFSVSGCRDSACQDCEPDGFVAATLYQVATDPIEIQPPVIGGIQAGRNYKCFSLSSSRGVSIYFAAYGICSQCPIPSPPTFPPIVDPTDFPTNFPTRSPLSLPPTRAPTDRPTKRPTWAPVTISPTRFPTRWPTRSPTESPTSFPTRTPVQAPVTLPPTRSPVSIAPTQSPSKRPIFIVPLPKPSSPPTSRPSAAPVSQQPKAAPAISPTNSLPTGDPSTGVAPVVPGGPTTDTPVVSPATEVDPTLSASTDSSVRLHTVTVQIGGTGSLDSEALAAWEKVTADHVSREAGPTEIRSAFVTVDNGTTRSIQATAVSRSEWDPETLWNAAFNTPEQRQDYLLKLQNSHPSFATTHTISVIQRSGINVVGYVLGAIGAASAMFFICVTLVALRRMRRPRRTKKGASRKEKADREKTLEPPVEHTNDIILLERSPSDGISTLGGYTGIQKEGDVHSVWDDPTVSVNIGYDFENNEYKESGQNEKSLASNSVDFSDASALQKLGETLFNDDKSFEQQYVENRVVPRNPRIEPFEVIVPPGLMGMVVDSAVAGLPPVVRAIRPESILTEKVRIGDRLLSVDHHDVTKMSARSVSNVISQRANQQRKLVFARVDE